MAEEVGFACDLFPFGGREAPQDRRMRLFSEHVFDVQPHRRIADRKRDDVFAVRKIEMNCRALQVQFAAGAFFQVFFRGGNTEEATLRQVQYNSNIAIL